MNVPPFVRRKVPPSLRAGFPLASAVFAVLATGLFWAATIVAPHLIPAARLLALFPVALASYHRTDWRPGMGYTLFFVFLFLWQAGWTAGRGDVLADLPGAATTALLLFGLSLVMRGIAASRGARESLAEDARERGELLQRTTDLDRVAAFVCQEARADLDAQEAGLLLRNPVDDRWELHTDRDVTPQPAFDADSLRLANWLARRDRPVLVQDLLTDGRFAQPGDIRSLLARPLLAANGEALAVLVLTHGEPGRFSPEHLSALDGLAQAAETALAHAGSYERAGWAAERLAKQLAAVQRVARELNASLQPETIAARALDGAVTIAGATAGAILALTEGREDVVRATTPAIDDGLRAALAQAARALAATLLDAPGSGLLLPAPRSRLLTPIRREGRSFGALLLETGEEAAFDRLDLQAMSALASHAAVALENARLFREVRIEREKSQQIVERMADGLITLDEAWRVRSANPAAERVLARPTAEIAGLALCDLLDCGQGTRAATCAMLEKTVADEAGRSTIWRPRPPGATNIALRLNAAALATGERGLVVLLHDVTREEELAQFQREVISTFSHELRSPLANINALTELVLEDSTENPVLLSRELIEMLGLQARRLGNLSDRTLNVARLDAGAWQLEARPLAVIALARAAARRWSSAAPQRAFNVLAPPETLWAWGDEDALGLILDNLLENAAKYSPADSPIWIAVMRKTPAFITIGVEDCGETLPAAERSLVFERFYRREMSATRATYGYGLGLYIVRKLSQAMGGDAWAEAVEGRGNRFVFSLPVMGEGNGQNPAGGG